MRFFELAGGVLHNITHSERCSQAKLPAIRNALGKIITPSWIISAQKCNILAESIPFHRFRYDNLHCLSHLSLSLLAAILESI